MHMVEFITFVLNSIHQHIFKGGWQLKSGSGSSEPGVYNGIGNIGTPGSRMGAASSGVYLSNDFFIFGGQGVDGNGEGMQHIAFFELFYSKKGEKNLRKFTRWN
jgi:hypothetical protein